MAGYGMETHERAYVVDNLDESEARLLDITNGLTAAQWNYREADGRWTIAENFEHCVLVEKAIAGGIQKALAGPVDPERRTLAAGKDKYVMGVAQAAGRKLEAQEAFQPTGRWSTGEMVAELRKVRAENTAWARETDAELRDHGFPHQALGELDCYQWLVVMALHGERHARQIDGIKAGTNFPR